MTALLLAATVTIASWYGMECAGKATASGQKFDPAGMTCASWDYPLGAILEVSRVDFQSRKVIVLCNDKGPAKRFYRAGRRLDLSQAAFAQLGDLRCGLLRVRVRRIR